MAKKKDSFDFLNENSTDACSSAGESVIAIKPLPSSVSDERIREETLKFLQAKYTQGPPAVTGLTHKILYAEVYRNCGGVGASFDERTKRIAKAVAEHFTNAFDEPREDYYQRMAAQGGGTTAVEALFPVVKKEPAREEDELEEDGTRSGSRSVKREDEEGSLPVRSKEVEDAAVAAAEENAGFSVKGKVFDVKHEPLDEQLLEEFFRDDELLPNAAAKETTYPGVEELAETAGNSGSGQTKAGEPSAKRQKQEGAAPQQLFNPDGSERGADDDVFDEVLEELGLQRDAGGGGVIGPVVAPAAQAAEPAAEPELPLIDAAAKIGFLSLANRVTPGEFKGHKYLDLREWYQDSKGNDEEWKHGSKGVTLNRIGFQKLIDLFPTIDEWIEQAGEDELPDCWASLVGTKRVTFSIYKNRKSVHIREYYRDNAGELKPGRKGISLSANAQYPRLKEMAATVKQWI